MPSILAKDKVAREEWHRLVRILVDQRVMTPAFMGSLAAYCLAWSMLVEDKRQGYPITTSLREFRACAMHMGLTPIHASKSNAAPDTTKDNVFSVYLGGKSG